MTFGNLIGGRWIEGRSLVENRNSADAARGLALGVGRTRLSPRGWLANVKARLTSPWRPAPSP